MSYTLTSVHLDFIFREPLESPLAFVQAVLGIAGGEPFHQELLQAHLGNPHERVAWQESKGKRQSYSLLPNERGQLVILRVTPLFPLTPSVVGFLRVRAESHLQSFAEPPLRDLRKVEVLRVESSTSL